MNAIWETMVCGYYSYGVNGRRGLTLMFVSNPGESKTSQIKLFSKAAGIGCVPYEGAGLEPQDIIGLPRLKDDDFYFVPPRKFRELRDNPNGGLLFGDEFTRQSSSVMAAALNLMLDGTTQAIDLGWKVARWAACNPAGQVGGIDLDPANASRFIWVEWPEMSTRDFQTYLNTRDVTTGEGAVPPDFEPARFERNLAEKWDLCASLASNYIGSFLVRNTTAFREPPPVEARAWANPRTWDMATRALAAVECHFGANAWDRKIDLLAGAVGRGHADSFCTWLRTMDLPDPADILDGRAQYDIASDARADRVHVILDSTLSVVEATLKATGKSDPTLEHSRIAAWCDLLTKAASQKAARDVAACSVARAMGVGSKFYEHKEFMRQVLALKDFVKVIGAVAQGYSSK
ncbi:MAG: hypothetical protein VW405_03790 [Rhodospirillaceae bacterium]